MRRRTTSGHHHKHEHSKSKQHSGSTPKRLSYAKVTTIGILDSEAENVLLELINKTLHCFQWKIPKWDISMIIRLSSAFALLSLGWYMQRGRLWSFISLILCLLELTINIAIVNLKSRELFCKLQMLSQELSTKGIEYAEVREPPSRAIILLRTWRRNHWRLISPNLLVKGDVVQCSPGEDLGVQCVALDIPDFAHDLFELMETPLERQMQAAFNSSTEQQDDKATITRQVHMAIEVLAVTVACIAPRLFGAMIAIFMLCTPLIDLIFKVYGCAKVLALVEVLQISKTPYTESAEVDEFDEEAPPPTKDIYLEVIKIIKVFLRACRCQLEGGNFWTLDLTETFGKVSILSYVDREGPIAMSFPVPMEIVFPHPESDDLAFGEFILNPNNPTNIRTNFYDFALSNDNLLAMGMSLMVASSCGVHTGQFRSEWHLRFPASIHPGRRLDPVFATCTCSISRELGIQASQMFKYARVADFWIHREIGISTTLNPTEYQGLFARIFFDRTRGATSDSGGENTLQMLAFGDLTSAASLSQHMWNSKKITPMPENLRRKLIELDDNLAASDLQCIGITYKPVFLDKNTFTGLANFTKLLKYNAITSEPIDAIEKCLGRKHIFLGALISGYEPKDDMQEMIDDLANAGVRFVYFSPYPESITKAFGDRLALETDWNSCIIMSHPDDATSTRGVSPSSRFTDPKSKLPRGVHNIRPHLLDVDDIPLHLSLFAECDVDSIVTMNSIYQEYDETVIIVGSTLNWSNSAVFTSADASIGMEPPGIRVNPTRRGKMSSIHLSAALTSLRCSFILPFDCSPYVMTEIIREARCLYRSHRAALFQLTIFILASLVTSFLYPEQSVYLAFISVALTLACLSNPYEAEIMKLMPHKDSNPFREYYFGAGRALLLLISMLIQASLSPAVSPLSVLIIATSATLLHSSQPINRYGPVKCHTWSLIACLIFITCLIVDYLKGSLGAVNIHWSVLNVVISTLSQEAIKYVWSKEVQQNEKRAKLLFNTKLGMHSPI